MRLLLISATCLLVAGVGWAHSIPTTLNPANGWLIAMFAAAGMTLTALNKIEVEVQS